MKRRILFENEFFNSELYQSFVFKPESINREDVKMLEYSKYLKKHVAITWNIGHCILRKTTTHGEKVKFFNHEFMKYYFYIAKKNGVKISELHKFFLETCLRSQVLYIFDLKTYRFKENFLQICEMIEDQIKNFETK